MNENIESYASSANSPHGITDHARQHKNSSNSAFRMKSVSNSSTGVRGSCDIDENSFLRNATSTSDVYDGNGQDLSKEPTSAFHYPPQMFTSAMQLLKMMDKKVVVILRDGRTLVGLLRTWDQYGSIVLQNTIERIYIEKYFAEKYQGVFILRGENIMLIGEFDSENSDTIPKGYQQIEMEYAQELQKSVELRSKKRELLAQKTLQVYGFRCEKNCGDPFLWN